MAGYTRQSSINDGDTISASLFNNEYNQLLNAFAYSPTDSTATGHRHDGSTGQGGNIFKIGDIDFLNKIEVDDANNRWGIYVEVTGVSTEQVRFQDGSIVPVVTNDIDLGSGSLQFKDLFIDGTANIDSLTLSSGSTVTVILDEDNLATNSDTALATQQSIKAYVDSQITANNELSEILVNGNTTGGTDISVSTGDDITFADSSKAIFGAGSDLQIYHDGSNSFVSDQGAGDLYIRSSNDLWLQNAGGTETYARFDEGASTYINYAGATKLTTTATGIDVTGTVTADGLTVDGGANLLTRTSSGAEIDVLEVRNNATAASTASTIKFVNSTAAGSNSGSSELVAVRTGTNTGDFKIRTSNSTGSMIDRLLVDSDGDISFYEDTGTTAKFFWDASAESLGIGTTTPAAELEVVGTGDANGAVLIVDDAGSLGVEIQSASPTILFNEDDTTDQNYQIRLSGGDLNFQTQNDSRNSAATKMTLDSAGNVGIGTTSPAAKLDTAYTDSATYSSTSPSADLILSRKNTGNTANETVGIRFDVTGWSGSTTGGAAIEAIQPSNASTADLAFLTRDAGTWGERMRINSSGLVGISETNPSANLHISTNNTSTTNTATIRLEDTDTTTLGNQGIGRIEFYGNDSSGAGAGVKAAIEALGEDGSGRTTLKFSTANAVANDVGAMYINSSGQVGIGTTSPASLLHASSNESTVLTIERTASGTEGKLLLSSATNENIIYSRDATTGAKPLRFEIGSSEAMRITSAGNLLVGKTASDTSVNGLEADNNGYTKITRTSGTANVNTVLQLNRLSTDGEILRLQKDGTEVGSIGSYVTGPSMFIGSGNTGVLFADGSDSVHPWDPSTNAGNDDALDLGSLSQRFKDLWLSGGAYLGGTAAANKLDDYEEGAWTPTVAGDATGAFSTAEGTYTKVGRLVFIEMYVVVSTNFTSNYIGGLPFTVGDFLTGTSLGQSAVVLTNAADTVTGSALEGSGNMRFFNDHNTASFHNPNTTNGGYRLSLCYQAT